MRIGILYDGESLTHWQRRALEQLGPGHEFHLLIAEGARTPRRKPVHHAGYYALNLLAIRNEASRRVSFDIPEAEKHLFTVDYDVAWAVLPDETVDHLEALKLDAILRFGLDLLRIPPAERLSTPILSFHHGDPRRFRGRPAGFYETLQGEPHVGQIVQILSNKLDAGEVLAFGETPAYPHSYRRTMREAFALSPYLLPQALRALQAGTRLPVEPTGRNYRLPSNLTVIRFALSMGWAWVKRLCYGAFVEKQWQVAKLAGPCSLDRIEQQRDRWENLEAGRDYSFIADPFFFTDSDDILCEALHRWRGTGDIVRVRGGRMERIDRVSSHASYPSSLMHDGERFILPEEAQRGTPRLYRLSESAMREAFRLDIHEEGLIDPTLLVHEGRHYLFANRASEGPSVLRLWHADRLEGRFVEHPQSPVRASIRGARMGGPVRTVDGRLVRTGQDHVSGYGDGLLFFEITDLGPDTYSERKAGALRFEGAKGPHTFDERDGTYLFDHYRDRFTPLAGFRRFMARIFR